MMAALILCLLQTPNGPLFREPVPPPQLVTDGPIELKVDVSSRSVLIAETITLSLQVEAPVNTLITLPQFLDVWGPFSVIDTDTVAELPVDGKSAARRWVKTIELESLETGELEIPRLEIVYRLPESSGGGDVREGVLRSRPISIQIGSVLNDQDSLTEFRDIKAAQPLPTVTPKRSNFRWFAAGIGIGITAMACLLVWSRRRRQPPADKWALREIELIESQYNESSINISQVYAQLSSVIRRFLEAQFVIPATAQSSTELISELPAAGCPDAVKSRLERFMTEADQLKFSGRVSLGMQPDESPFDSIRTIVRETSQHATLQPSNSRERS